MTTTASTATELRLPAAVKTLERTPSPTGYVLSAFVDASPTRMIGNAYQLAFRDAIRALRKDLDPHLEERFEAAAAQAEAHLTKGFAPKQHGLAIFASGDEAYFFVVGLVDAPVEHVAWSSDAEIAPLEAMVDDNERIAVVIFDAERARLLSVFMGEIESEQHIRDDVPGKQATGGWYSLAQTNIQRHREDHLRRHAERACRLLVQELRAHPFDRLLLAGPDEALAVLRRELPRPLRARLAGEFHLEMFATDAQVLAVTRKAAGLLERAWEEHVVDELLSDGRNSVLGLSGTLMALAEGRVHLLVVGSTFHAPGAHCARCDRLTPAVPRCPGCGSATSPVADLRESVVADARRAGGRLEFASGVAAQRLEKYGGIGAWTRF